MRLLCAAWPLLNVGVDAGTFDSHVFLFSLLFSPRDTDAPWRDLEKNVDYKDPTAPLQRYLGALYHFDASAPYKSKAPRSLLTSMDNYVANVVLRFKHVVLSCKHVVLLEQRSTGCKPVVLCEYCGERCCHYDTGRNGQPQKVRSGQASRTTCNTKMRNARRLRGASVFCKGDAVACHVHVVWCRCMPRCIAQRRARRRHASACLNTSEISNAPTRGYVMDRRVAGSIHMPYKQASKQANKQANTPPSARHFSPLAAAGRREDPPPHGRGRTSARAVGRRGRACWRWAHACTL